MLDPDAPATFSAQAMRAVPGLALSGAVAAAALALAPVLAPLLPIPAMVLALFIGIAVNPFAARPVFQLGLLFCVKDLLRWAVALLGLRIALGDIAALGMGTALLVIVSMVVTIVSGFLFARALGQPAPYGALAGAGAAVCGASATLATATVLPPYKGKEADVVFVVVAVNALSTAAMVLYPLLCRWLEFEVSVTGVMLGATIHDVAQVVGAGYSVSESAGNTAVIVKLYRVFLLMPVVLGIGWWFVGAGAATGRANVPVPIFALVFLTLCLLNSIAEAYEWPFYRPLKVVLVGASAWGLVIAIAALGLGSSLSAIAALGWRHVATVSGTTLVLLVVVTAALLAGV
jgi:uncharacterized integral membrane protein (TIGR00698 family)